MSTLKWSQGRVDDFFLLQRGFDITKANSTHGDIPVVSSSGLSYFHSESKAVGPGVVTGRKGKLGSVHYVEGEYWPHDTALWVKDFKQNLPRYVYYFLQNLNLEKYNEALAVPTLNRNNVHRLKCSFPSIEEQKVIVNLLSKWDSAIEKTQALVKAKTTQLEWLTTTLINKAAYKRVSSREFMTEVSSRNRENKISRVLSVTNKNGFVLPEDRFERRVASSNVSNYKIVKQGQYAYNPSRINVGSIARLDDWGDGILSPMYVVFKLDEARVCSEYFSHWLRSSETRQRIRNKAQGSVRETVNFRDLGSIQIPIPSQEEQKSISGHLNTAQREISLLNKLVDNYLTQKRGLMKKLLTGNWRIKNSTEVA